MARRRTALIVGAGIGGLAAGHALRRAGWDIRLFERADAPRAVGFGLGLAPNAMAALHELGLATAAAAQGVTLTAVEFRRADGTALRRLHAPPALLATGHPMVMIMRPALHALLLDAVGRDAIAFGRDAVAFEQTAGEVRLRFADGTAAAGDLLVGADGVASAVRAQLHPADRPPRASGHWAVRGASPAVDRLDGRHGLLYYGPGIESGLLQASATAVYWFVSLLAADIPSRGLDPHALLDRCCAGFDPRWQAIRRATAPGDVRLDELLERDPLPRWGEGRVTLLGDAAHPMLPHTGQGAAQAIEDAVALGLALRAEADAPAALRRYEAARIPRTTRIVRTGPRIARMTTTHNPLLTTLRDTAIRAMPRRLLIRAFLQPDADPHRALR